MCLQRDGGRGSILQNFGISAVGENAAESGAMSISSESSSGVMMMMAKYMKQELSSDAEDEGLVPNLPPGAGRFAGSFAVRKVPSLSDLSDPESSLGK